LLYIVILYCYRSRPQFNVTPEVASSINKLKNFAAEATSALETYKEPPKPIDFKKVQVKDQGLIDMMEAFYKSAELPPTTYAYPAEEAAADDARIAMAAEMDTYYQEATPVLQNEIEFYTTHRSHLGVSVDEMRMWYPLIHEEIMDELERREWFKDTEFDLPQHHPEEYPDVY
jgi:hypothetical protein